MDTPFDKLNRLRKVAGQRPLKSWKASQDQLNAQIKRLEDDGYEDPGPDPIPVEADAAPAVDFGDDAKADIPPTADDIPALAKDKPAKEVTKVPPRLARGTDTETHCKKAISDARPKSKKEQKRLDKIKSFVNGDIDTLDKKKKSKKSKIKKNKDGTGTKTTTSGKKRKLGKDLMKKIEKQSKEKHSDKRSDKDNFTVADLARECDMDPKVARAKLRRHEDKIKKLHSKGQDRWVFPNSARKALKEILQPK